MTPLSAVFVETDESTMPIEVIYQNIAAAKKCKAADLQAGKKLVSLWG
jgi:hypothetical protein